MFRIGESVETESRSAFVGARGVTANGSEVFLLGDENIRELVEVVTSIVNVLKAGLYIFKLFKQLILLREFYLNKIKCPEKEK